MQQIKSRWLRWRKSGPSDGALDEATPLIAEASNFNGQSEVEHSSDDTPDRRSRFSFRSLWTSKVISTMIAYFLISGHVGTFPSLWAIFLSTPAAPVDKQHPPFQLHGGIGMDPRGVGLAMSLQGVIAVVVQVLVYPTLADRFGTIRVWRASLFFFPLAYTLAPFCILVILYTREPSIIWVAVISVLLLFVIGRVGTTPATTMIINDCTPHPSVRATIHTIATILSSLSRTIFPTIALYIFGQGLGIGMAWIGFWFIAALAVLACISSLWVGSFENSTG